MERCWKILEAGFDTIYLFLKATATPSPCFSCEFQLCISRAMLAPAGANCCTTPVRSSCPHIQVTLFSPSAFSPIGNFVGMRYLKSTQNMLTYGQACLNMFGFSLGLEQENR